MIATGVQYCRDCFIREGDEIPGTEGCIPVTGDERGSVVPKRAVLLYNGSQAMRAWGKYCARMIYSGHRRITAEHELNVYTRYLQGDRTMIPGTYKVTGR